MKDVITKQSLDPFIDESFKVRDPNNGVVELKLIESTDNSTDDNELFWFIFEGPFDKPLPQKTYSLFHKKAGLLTMFLVPVSGQNTQMCFYQALFNRLKP